MKVGLLPWWARPSSATAMASLSLLPFSIPLLIFSRKTVVSMDISWGHIEQKERCGVNRRQRGGEETQVEKVKDPALSLAGRETRARGRGEERLAGCVPPRAKSICP